MFLILACVYFVMMFLGHLLLKKPADWVEDHTKQSVGDFLKKFGQNFKFCFTNREFAGIWLMFYINIACGLALISQEKPILQSTGLSLTVIAWLQTATAVANAAGRLGFSAAADGLKDRNTIYKWIFSLSILFTALTIVTRGVERSAEPALMILCIALLIVVNAGYGGGFSNVPTLLSDHFGMKSISSVHGMCLSAWAIAGLTGNQIASFIVKHTGEFSEKMLPGGKTVLINPVGYQKVLYFTVVMYVIAMVICCTLVGKPHKEE